jgi:hypothetical protein
MRYFVARAVRVLRGMGWQAEMSASRSGVDGTGIARQAAEDGVDVVFAVGGDGTIRGVASGLTGSRTALGILPAGTMNVFAIELGLRPFTWHRLWAMTANVRKLAAARAYDVDLGRCGSDQFLLWAGIGLDALTIQQLEPRPHPTPRRREVLNRTGLVPHHVIGGEALAHHQREERIGHRKERATGSRAEETAAVPTLLQCHGDRPEVGTDVLDPDAGADEGWPQVCAQPQPAR